MSDYKPITGELRKYATVSWDPWPDARDRLYQMCDRIDAVHAGLERENARLKAELDEAEHRGWTRGYDEGFANADDWMADNRDAMAEHGWVRKDKEHIISHATIEVTPHIDWSRMADELNEFVEIVRGIAGGAE